LPLIHKSLILLVSTRIAYHVRSRRFLSAATYVKER